MGQNFRRKGFTDVSLILTQSGRDAGLSYRKEKRNHAGIFCHLSTMHECDRQTNRQNRNIDINK